MADRGNVVAADGVLVASTLPWALEYTLPPATERLAHMAVLLGLDTTGLSQEEAA